MIYTHVRLLCANGIDAAVLHSEPGFRPAWMAFDAPRVYLGNGFRATESDLLVVPEVHAAESQVLNLAKKRIVFVQASSYIAPCLGGAKSYRALGYQGAIAIMPHVREIVERHYGLEAPVIPPCIAPWFRRRGGISEQRRVVICPSRMPRLPIIRQMLHAHARRSAGKWWRWKTGRIARSPKPFASSRSA